MPALGVGLFQDDTQFYTEIVKNSFSVKIPNR